MKFVFIGNDFHTTAAVDELCLKIPTLDYTPPSTPTDHTPTQTGPNKPQHLPPRFTFPFPPPQTIVGTGRDSDCGQENTIFVEDSFRVANIQQCEAACKATACCKFFTMDRVLSNCGLRYLTRGITHSYRSVKRNKLGLFVFNKTYLCHMIFYFV